MLVAEIVDSFVKLMFRLISNEAIFGVLRTFLKDIVGRNM